MADRGGFCHALSESDFFLGVAAADEDATCFLEGAESVSKTPITTSFGMCLSMRSLG
jgi:hypothetical protein